MLTGGESCLNQVGNVLMGRWANKFVTSRQGVDAWMNKVVPSR